MTSTRIQRLSFMSFGEDEKPLEPVAKAAEVKEEVTEKFEPTPPPKLITEAEVNAARKEGYDEGYKEASAAIEAQHDKETEKREEAIKSLLEVIANRITLAAEEQIAYRDSKQKVLGQLAVAVARKVAGDAVKSDPQIEVEAILKECMPLVVNEARLTIVVSEKLRDALKLKLDSLRQLLPGFTGDLVVEANADMGEADCRVEWKNGYAERDTEKLWNEIQTIITNIGKI